MHYLVADRVPTAALVEYSNGTMYTFGSDASTPWQMGTNFPLLYGAATHVNTSGVFKACHKGFGGHGRDAQVRLQAGFVAEQSTRVEAEFAFAIP
jgi:adenine-specific DNA-methyltransferase